MLKQNFWNDAAKYGALLGVVTILFEMLSLLWQNMLLSIASVVVFVTVLYLVTRVRANRCGGGPEGFSYGQGLKYILWMMIFGGVIAGAWGILGRNVIFPQIYKETLNTSLAAMEQSMPSEMIDHVSEMSNKIMFSPIWIVVTTILGMLIKGIFFGLFVAAFTRREPNIFDPEQPENGQNANEA